MSGEDDQVPEKLKRLLFPGVGGAAAASLLDELKAKQQKHSSRAPPALPQRQPKEPPHEHASALPPPIPPHIPRETVAEIIAQRHHASSPAVPKEPPQAALSTAPVTDKPPPIPRRPKLKPRPQYQPQKVQVVPLASVNAQDRANQEQTPVVDTKPKLKPKAAPAPARTKTETETETEKQVKTLVGSLAAENELASRRSVAMKGGAPKPLKTRKDLTPKKVFEEWQTYYSADNQPYYVNRKSGETTWTKPAELFTDEEIQLQGDFVWVKHEDCVWIPSRILERQDDAVVVAEVGYGLPPDFEPKGRRKVPISDVGPPISHPAQSLRNLTNDLVQLEEVHEASILDLLRRRYSRDKIYTRVGDILVAVNPFKPTSLFTPTLMHKYKSEQLSFHLPPHPYEIINSAYVGLIKDNKNQSILISGESGAGKTVTVKVCLEFLSEVTSSEDSAIEEKILAANPILEAFGNAKTIRNDNSSRFGKFMEIHFARSLIKGCYTVNYLLEKSRVVAQAAGERNFHIFYYLCNVFPESKKQRFKLLDGTFRFVNNGASEDLLDQDEKECGKMEDGFREMGFDDSTLDSIYAIIAAILHLGNVDFEPFGTTGSKVTAATMESLHTFCDLLGCDDESMLMALTKHVSQQRDGLLERAFNPGTARDARNALARHLYGKLFDWLVQQVNLVLVPDTSILNARSRSQRNLVTSGARVQESESGFIGILDIFGFEIFEVNSFEQLCINFANEKLQQIFNRHTFTLEEETYIKEGIDFKHTEFHDSQPLLSFLGLAEGGSKAVRDGVFQLLDEQTTIGSGNDEKFLHSISTRHKDKRSLFSDYAKSSRTAFTVFHYAGAVDYETSGFVVKNADKLYPNMSEALCNAQNPIVQDVFNKDKTTTKKRTQASVFMRQLQQLEQRTMKTFSRYIRCIKPNSKKCADYFDSPLCLQQLRFSGVFEAISIRKVGYPFRLTHQQFYTTYSCLRKERAVRADAKGRCEDLLKSMGPDCSDCQLGQEMVLYRAKEHKVLEIKRLAVHNEAATTIQRIARGKLVRGQIPSLVDAKKKLGVAIGSRQVSLLESTLALTKGLFFKIKEAYDAEVVLQVLQKETSVIPVVRSLLSESTESCSEGQLVSMEALKKEVVEYRKRDTLAFSGSADIDQMLERCDVLLMQRKLLKDIAARMEDMSLIHCAQSLLALRELEEVAKRFLRYGNYVGFKEGLEAASNAVVLLSAELELLKQTQQRVEATSIKSVQVRTEVSTLDLSSCNVELLRSSSSELLALRPQSLDGKDTIYQLSCIIELREAVIDAVDKGESASDEFWSKVEVKVKEAQQLYQSEKGFLKLDSSELDLVVAELGVRSAVDDVITKLDAAVQERNDRDLEVALSQGAQLNLEHHKDTEVVALMNEAHSLLPVLKDCRRALEVAVSEVTLDNLSISLVKQTECLFGEGVGAEGFDLVSEVRQLFAHGVVLSHAAELAVKTWYLEAVKEIVRGCRETRLKLSHLQELESFLSLSKAEQLETQQEAAIKFGNYLRGMRISIERRNGMFQDPGATENLSLKHFPNLKSPEDFAKRFGINWAKYKEKMLCFYHPTFGKIHTSLTVLSSPNTKKSTYLFKNIFGIMGDKVYTSEALDGLLQDLLEQGLDNVELRDEIFCQVCKQLTNNPRAESVQKGWNLMSIVLATFSPSRELINYLENFLRLPHNYKPEVVQTLHKTLICGDLLEVPELQELARERSPGKLDVWFGGQRTILTCTDEKWALPEQVDQVPPNWADAIYNNETLTTFLEDGISDTPRFATSPPPPPPHARQTGVAGMQAPPPPPSRPMGAVPPPPPARKKDLPPPPPPVLRDSTVL